MGMSIGSHGRDHVDLRKVDDAALVAEAGEAQRALARHCREPVDSFAIPFGSYDRRALSALRHFRRVYSSDGVRALGAEHPVPRVAVTRDWTPDTVASAVARRESAIDRALYRAKAQVKKLR
jgi:peptidoglycan/xylan/chitin deacetylase (PgdA/CDA1 family)